VQDFEGQRKAERYAQLILVSSAVIGFLLGFALQDLRVTFGLFGSGLVGALFVRIRVHSVYAYELNFCR
jgi:signal peptidase complex subunit 1